MGQSILGEFDVIVAGGGPSGLIAATAASRLGAKTLLIEREGFLGGMATSALVPQFFGFFVGGGRVVRGIPDEFIERIRKAGGSNGFEPHILGELRDSSVSVTGFPFNPEITKIVADELVIASGARILFHTYVTGTSIEGKRVTGLVTEGINGRREIRAKIIVDATGDAVAAKTAGAEVVGEEEGFGRARMPLALVFRVTDIDLPRLQALSIEAKRKIALHGLERKEIFGQSLSFWPCPGTNDAFCLMGKIFGIDALDDEDLSQAEIIGRQQIKSIMNFVQREVPGLEKCKLAAIATHVAIRETRRIVGLYTLTEQDIYEHRPFEDSMAMGAGYIDLHDHSGPAILLKGLDRPTQIPMRCLLPVSVRGLIVTGRPISSTRLANSAIRQMGTGMALGQAAGTLAAVAAKKRILPTEVSAAEVQRILRENGAVISEEDIR